MLDKNTVPTKLLWMDLEMTGLDVAHEVIIEVAVVVTDFDFQTLATYEAVIKQSDAALEAMSEWPKTQHGLSGLTERVRSEGRPEAEVTAELAALISTHFGEEMAILAGNSIHNDRVFIKRYWPQVDKQLHYRMLDVSSFKIVMQGKYGVMLEKNNDHRALGDIQASIAELKQYLEWFTQQSSRA
jgi:oligoribonuclease